MEVYLASASILSIMTYIYKVIDPIYEQGDNKKALKLN